MQGKGRAGAPYGTFGTPSNPGNPSNPGTRGAGPVRQSNGSKRIVCIGGRVCLLCVCVCVCVRARVRVCVCALIVRLCSGAWLQLV